MATAWISGGWSRSTSEWPRAWLWRSDTHVSRFGSVNRRTHRGRLALIVASAALLGAFAVLSFGRRISQRAPWVGVEWVDTGLGVTALTVEPKGPAATAGLLPGDVLVSAGGKPVHGAVGASDSPWRVPAGTGGPIPVRRTGAG